MRVFVVTAPRSMAEVVSDRLFTLGSPAVEERVHESDPSAVELWSTVGDSGDAERRAEGVLSDLDAVTWRIVTVADDVDSAWRKFATATIVDDGLTVVPAWKVTEPASPGRLTVAIDPGAAFGLGDHPTTHLTLRTMRAVWNDEPDAPVVLDVGSGSGVLGIVAARMGARRVVALDRHAAAIEATGANSARNGVSDVVEVATTPLAEVDGEFDIVLANLLGPILVDLAHDLRRVLAPDGVLIVSGILADRHDHVLAALEPLRVVRSATMGEWAAVTLCR